MFLSQNIEARSHQISGVLLTSLLLVMATSVAGVLVGLMGLGHVLGLWVAVSLYSLSLLGRFERWQQRLPLQLGFTLAVQSIALLIGLS